jgi:hypothetical protein
LVNSLQNDDFERPALKKQLEFLQKQLAKAEMSQKESEKKQPAVKEVEMLKFTMESPFVLLPQLSGVPHPLHYGKANSYNVSVGSRAWYSLAKLIIDDKRLKVLDQLRTVGWPFYGEMGTLIKIFKLQKESKITY